MPKRKESQLPIIKSGKNGDFFCYFSGKKIYLARTAKEAKANLLKLLTQEEAISQKKEKISKKKEKISVLPQNTTSKIVKVNEILLDFIKNSQNHREISKIKRVCKLVRDMYGDMDAANFGQVAFQTVRKKLVQENLSYSYINDLMAFVRNAFRFGVENRKLPESVFFFLSIVKPLRRGQAKTLPPRLDVPDEEIVKTLPHLLPTVRDMVVLQRISGMRPSEMFKLRACDLDRSQPDVWVYAPVGKTARFGIERNIAFGRFEQEILLRRMAGRKKTDLLFTPLDTMRENYGDGYAKDGRNSRQLKDAYDKDSYRRAITRAIDRVNQKYEEEGSSERIQHWTPYQLRHSSATFISLIMGREAAATLLGHTSTRITQVYDHSAKQKVINTVRQRDALVGDKLAETFSDSVPHRSGQAKPSK